MIISHAVDSYREQLRRWSRALAMGDITEVCADVVQGEAEDVRRFLANNTGERRKLLRQELAFVALAFDDFDGAIDAYLRAVPPTAYDPMRSDRERFLSWLRAVWPLTAQQSDFVAYQQAEYAVLALARERRAEHLAFQRMRTQGRSFDADGNERVHLNPIRAWARLALPGRDAGAMLFFADGERIASIWPAPPLELVRSLAAEPRTLEECAELLAPIGQWKAAALCHDLADKGLLAFT